MKWRRLRPRGGRIPKTPEGDNIPAFLSPGKVACLDCDWTSSGLSEFDRMMAFAVHRKEEHPRT